jgi:hypothetical protein
MSLAGFSNGGAKRQPANLILFQAVRTEWAINAVAGFVVLPIDAAFVSKLLSYCLQIHDGLQLPLQIIVLYVQLGHGFLKARLRTERFRPKFVKVPPTFYSSV